MKIALLRQKCQATPAVHESVPLPDVPPSTDKRFSGKKADIRQGLSRYNTHGMNK